MRDLTWADNAAVDIGERLLADAVIDGPTATWWVQEAVEGVFPSKTERRLARGSLYGGTAGIALFLTELAAITRRHDFRSLARLALEHALNHGRDGPAMIHGFHGGMAGVVFAVAAHLRHWEEVDLRTRAEDLLRVVATHENDVGNVDVISGAAGSILGLLSVADVFDPDGIDATCISLGRRLIEAADAEPWGISWPSGVPRLANLCGLAHGAAGMGLALLELHARTGRDLFLSAAQEAFAYEAHWFDEEQRNWADLRNAALDLYRTENRLDQLKGLVRSGGPLPLSEAKYMTAWCHGAPGIALTRARGFELLGHRRYRDQAAAAIPLLRASLSWTHAGHSICHGFMGNAECLLGIAARLSLADLQDWTIDRIETVTSAVVSGTDRWRSGRLNQVADPTLMVGEAGIGLSLLGLSHPVPSAVLPMCVHRLPAHLVEDRFFLDLRIATGCFSHTSAAMGSKTLKEVLQALAGQETPCVGEIERRLAAMVSDDDSLAEAFWADSVALERVRVGHFDRGLSFLAGLMRHDESSSALVLAPWVSVKERIGQSWLLYADTAGRWAMRRIRPQLAAFLEVFRHPVSVADATGLLSRMSGEPAAALKAWVEEQAGALGQAGILISAPLSAAIVNSATAGTGPPAAEAATGTRSVAEPSPAVLVSK